MSRGDRHRVALWLLRQFEGSDALVGDVIEDLERRQSDGRGPRFPRLWFTLQVWSLVGATALATVVRSLRVTRFVARDATRALRATPGSTVFALAILTLGIGAATVTFSVVDAVVIRSLPFDDDDRLVVAGPAGPGGISQASAAEFLAWRDQVPAFDDLAALGGAAFLSVPGAPEGELLPARAVTANLFDVLGVSPEMGALFTADHEVEGRDAVVVIGHRLWQRAFDADPSVIGRILRQTLNDGARDLMVVAVMPPGFTYPYGSPFETEAWVPYVVPASDLDLNRGLASNLQLVGRLRSDATTDEAASQMRAVAGALLAPVSYINADERAPDVVLMKDALVGDVRGWMLLVLWAVVLVMVVACVNVANVMLARAHNRAHELSVRAALGASRSMLGAALVVESLMLSSAAVLLGLFLANWGLDAVTATLPPGIARVDEIDVNLRVLAAAAGAAVATGLFFGLVPAWQASRVALASSLKDAARAATAARRGWRSAFVTVEVAVVALLLVVSTLFVASFVRVLGVDLGFERRGLVTFSLPGMSGRVPEVLDALGAIPGVASVATLTSGSAPLVGAAYGRATGSSRFRPADAPDGAPLVSIETSNVSSTLFDTLGIEVVRGRAFTPDETPDQAIVLDEVAAVRLFGEGVDPVGRAVTTGDGQPAVTVVGVVRAIRSDGPERPERVQAYRPLVPGPLQPHFVVRSAVSTLDVLPAIRMAVDGLLPPGDPRPELRTVDDAFAVLTEGRRFNASLMAAFGFLALVIGAAGVYAVMSSLVAQQRREFGVRLAVGATRPQVLAGVLRSAAGHLVVGLGVGLVAGRVLSELFASLLFEVRPGEVYVYAIVAAVLATVGLMAALGPARRASRVDPMVTLRAD